MLPALLGWSPFIVASPVEGGLLSLLATDPVVGSLIHCFSGSASSSVLPMLQSDSLLSNFCGGRCHFLRHPVGSKLPWQLVPLSIAAEVALDGLLPQHVVLDCCWILFVQRCLPPLLATRSCCQFLKRLMPLFVFMSMLRPRLLGEPFVLHSVFADGPILLSTPSLLVGKSCSAPFLFLLVDQSCCPLCLF